MAFLILEIIEILKGKKALFSTIIESIFITKFICPNSSCLTKQLYLNARTPLKGKMYNTSKGIIGKYHFVNSLDELDNLERNRSWTDDGLRVLLKQKLNFNFDQT